MVLKALMWQTLIPSLFLVYGNNYVEISSVYNSDLVECNICNTIFNKWFVTLSEGLRSNVNDLREIIEVRDGGKSCANISIGDVRFIVDNICIKYMNDSINQSINQPMYLCFQTPLLDRV